MNWFWIAITGTFIWSVNNHIDKLILGRYYKKVRPATPMLLSSVVCLVFVALIAIFKTGIPHVSAKSALLPMLAGIMYYFAAFPYYYSLKKDEVSRVVPLFQAQPFFAYVLGAVFLSEYLGARQIVGGLIIIFGSVLISLDLDNKFRLKKSVFWLMMFSTFLFATGLFLFKYTGTSIGFWPTAFFLYLGTAIPGIAFLIFPNGFRTDLFSVLKQSGKQAVGFSLLAETNNLVARSLFSYAVLLAPLALVVLVNGFQPIFVLLIGITLTLFLPKLGKENITKSHLVQKATSIAAILIGSYLLLIK